MEQTNSNNNKSVKELLSENVVDATGKSTKTEDVFGSSKKGCVVGLYFSASWCPPCQRLSPQLAGVYKQINKDEKEKKFEIILVCDQSKEEAEKYFSHMPWLSIPHDKEEIKKNLFKHFDIEGIPHLILFEADTGNKIVDDGVSRIFENGPDCFPWTDAKIAEVEKEAEKKMSAKTIQELLATPQRNYVVNNKGEHVPVSSLATKEIIGLYFSAHWCPPCKIFTPILANIYKDLKAQNKSFEIVFLSSDRTESDYKSYFAEMPWLAVPYEDDSTKKELSNFYMVRGIPSLVLIHGTTGKLLTLEGRDRITTTRAKGFPYTEERAAELKSQDEVKMRNEPKTLNVKSHPEHELELRESVYGGPYGCDLCHQGGQGWAYHCEECGYDLHPECANKDKAS